eukprot:7997942-Pyramimonas_sp.AAC.1
MQAGLPPPYWTYAVRYFCLCYNTRTPAEGQSGLERRFGCQFNAPRLPFGSLIRYVPPPESRFRTAKTWSDDDSRDILGVCAQSGGIGRT